MMDLRGFLIRKEGRRSECPSTLRREFLWASLLLPGEFIQHLPHHFCQQSRVWALVTRSSLLVYLLVNAFLVDTTHDAIEWEESRNQHWLLSPIVCWEGSLFLVIPTVQLLLETESRLFSLSGDDLYLALALGVGIPWGHRSLIPGIAMLLRPSGSRMTRSDVRSVRTLGGVGFKGV
ncbi:hypothetical protein Tco_0039078 [Tanacetum coccineum]